MHCVMWGNRVIASFVYCCTVGLEKKGCNPKVCWQLILEMQVKEGEKGTPIPKLFWSLKTRSNNCSVGFVVGFINCPIFRKKTRSTIRFFEFCRQLIENKSKRERERKSTMGSEEENTEGIQIHNNL